MVYQSLQAGPFQAYQRLLSEEAIRADEAQLNAVYRLQNLHEQLKDHRPRGPFYFRDRFRNIMKKPEYPNGLYLWGGVGRGKSMLMDLFFAQSDVILKRRVHFHAFMQEVHKKLQKMRSEAGAKGENKGDPIKPLAENIADEAALLCLDEMQITDIADAMLVARLFTHLLDLGTVVVTTSNRHPKDLYKGGINRELFTPFIDLIEKRLDIFQLDNGQDYRLAFLKTHPVYLAPYSPAVDYEIDRMFEHLTDRTPAEPMLLEVMGRQLEIKHQAKGVARVLFPELCAAALGPGDFIEVAKTFHTLIIEHVPRLGPDNRNEAKRFVTLIDELYEHKVNLIVSAEAPPEQLYEQGDGAFEFERTVSRLMEMQSADYIHLAHRG